MSIIKDLEKDIKRIVEKSGYQVENLILQPSGRRDLGQFQLNDAMNLAKVYKKSPRVIAEDIVKGLEKDNRFTNLNIAGPGFINITLTDQYLGSLLTKIYEDKSQNIDKREKKKVVLDYGGANVAKALHVGHLRSANIGEALKRLARTLGYEVIGDAHLGDYGRPLGLVILEIKKRYPNLAYFDENYTGDYSEIKLPITNKDLEEIYPYASIKSKEDEEYLEEAREITFKIQNHENGYYDLWKRVIEISKQDIKKVYDMLNVDFELWLGESDSQKYVEEMVKKTVETFGTVDVLVNNAGINIPRLLVDPKDPKGQYELDEAVWDKVCNVNLKGVFFCAQAVGRVLVEKGSGVIINMSSESGLEGSEGQSVYAATKAAVVSLTRSWAKELGKHGVRVVGVAPGIMEATGLRTIAYESALAYTRGITVDDLRAGYAKTSTTPLGRSGKLTEVADMCVYLASDRSSYVHGVTINVAGGKTRG